MIKIMFVCLGNICRSPMSEFILKDLVKKAGMEKDFIIESSATSYEEIGSDMYYEAKNKLIEMNIPFEKRKATRLAKADYNQYDYIIGMEKSNIENIKKIVGDDVDKKIYRLLDFTDNPRDIADPWYTRNFDITYEEILEGCEALLNKIRIKS